MIIEAQEIKFLEPKSKTRTKSKKDFCESFTYEPENIEEASLGNLYLLGKLNNVSEDLGHLVNLLSAIIKREYYKNPQNGPLKSLEQSLKTINQHLADLAQGGNLQWLGKLNFLGAAICQNQIYFTQTGKACSFLFREKHLVDISRKLIPSPEKPHPQRTFQNVVSGKIEPEDILVLGTQELTEALSPRGLRQILFSSIDLPLASISQQIEKIIRERKNPSLGTALLIKTRMDEEKPISVNPPSIENYLTPPINLDEIISTQP